MMSLGNMNMNNGGLIPINNPILNNSSMIGITQQQQQQQQLPPPGTYNNMDFNNNGFASYNYNRRW